MFGMSLSAPAGQPLQSGEQFPYEVPKFDPVPLSCWASMSESTPCRRARTVMHIDCAKCRVFRVDQAPESRRIPGPIACQFRRLSARERTVIPVAFLGVRVGGLLPSGALFSLLPIIAVTWYEWELRPRQKYELAAIRSRLLDHSQGLVSLRISSGIGRRISTSSGVNWTRRLRRDVEASASF